MAAGTGVRAGAALEPDPGGLGARLAAAVARLEEQQAPLPTPGRVLARQPRGVQPHQHQPSQGTESEVTFTKRLQLNALLKPIPPTDPSSLYLRPAVKFLVTSKDSRESRVITTKDGRAAPPSAPEHLSTPPPIHHPRPPTSCSRVF